MRGDSMNSNQKIALLRTDMAKYRLDAYIINSADPHQSEYLPENHKDRQWLTGFTGSQGTAVVTNDNALLWTDGRYFIQAENQIENTEFHLMKMMTPGYPTIPEFLIRALPLGKRVGINPKTTSQASYEELCEKLNEVGIEVVDEYDLIGELWTDRPETEVKAAYLHEVQYTGLSTEEKLAQVREKLKEKNADATVLTTLDDICWLYNIRGFDIENNPVVTSYAIIDMEYAYLFIDFDKLSIEVNEDLINNGVDTENYEAISSHMNLFRGKKILLDKNKTSRELYKLLDPSNTIIDSMDITTFLKATKNKVEEENQRHAYIKDGVALTKFIYWLKHTDEEINELDAAEKLENFRKKAEHYVMPSFDTISAYGGNAAMMHYRATDGSYSKIEKKGLYLVDSGGQYLDGTTDITRTIAMGKLTSEEKTDFTLVLKGHLNLLGTVFLEGTTGHALDVIARRPIWLHRMDYKSGTGHGVGFMLGVHEGPHRIAQKYNDVALREGMVVTIEPGIYKSGKHGIRTENVVIVKKDKDTPDGQFLHFDVMSLAPIDVDAIDRSLLDNWEIEILNKYHKEVQLKLQPYINDEEKVWLREVTSPIK